MPKLKWNDCSATMLSTRCHEGKVSKRVNVNVHKKCISLGIPHNIVTIQQSVAESILNRGKPSDRKWVDYSNSKIFIKKRPNHEYNILRQVLSRDKRLSESLKYEVKWTDYSQHFMISPDCSPPSSPSLSPSSPPSIPSSPSSSTSSTPSSPESSIPSSPEQQKYTTLSHALAASYAGLRATPPTSNLLSASTPELSSIAIATTISFADGTYLQPNEHQYDDCSFQPPPPTTTDPFFTEIQPLPIMELYYT